MLKVHPWCSLSSYHGDGNGLSQFRSGLGAYGPIRVSSLSVFDSGSEFTQVFNPFTCRAFLICRRQRLISPWCRSYQPPGYHCSFSIPLLKKSWRVLWTRSLSAMWDNLQHCGTLDQLAASLHYLILGLKATIARNRTMRLEGPSFFALLRFSVDLRIF